MSAVAAPVFVIVIFDAGAVTVVEALAQLVVVQELPGVAGLDPPDGSTDA